MTRSEHDTETLIRESLDRLAARAPDGQAVREALARAGRPRRAPVRARAGGRRRGRAWWPG